MGDSKNPKLERCSLSLFALTLGPWLGDSIIRDRSDIDSLPAAKFKKKKGYNLPPKKGFGPEDSGSLQASIEEERNGFGCWSNGVQKVAMTFNYEENEVSHDFTWGKSIGAYTSAEMQNWQAKGVIDKNGMFSWLKPSERPLYIDYYSGSYAGCIVGSTYIRAPRFLEFSEITKGRERTTFTEFALFTKGGSGRDPSVALFDPDFMSNLDDDFQDIFCSRISRFYDTDGRLKQGSTSFFTLKNMMYDEFKPDSSSPVVD